MYDHAPAQPVGEQTKATSLAWSTDALMRAAWEALVNDAHVAVMVVEPSGRIQFANACAAHCMKLDPQRAVGRTMYEGFTPEFVDERTGFMRRALTTGQPVVVDGIIQGVLRRCTYRPIKSQHSRAECVLNVGRTLSAEQRQKDGVQGVVRAAVDDLGELSGLTARELEILGLIGRGMTTAEIADQLRRSVKTVEWHRVSLGDKLRAGNRVELARIALRAGL